MNRKMSSLQYIDFVQNQLPHETVDQIISVGIMNLRVLIARYIPNELVSEKRDILFETMVTLLGKEGVSKDPIVDQIFGFLGNVENLRTALVWLEQSKIIVNGQELYDLQKTHKMAILRNLFKSTDFSLDQKMELLQGTLGEDQSDLAENCRATCMTSLPDPAVKERVWQELIDPNNTDSLYIKNAKMAGFYSLNQIDIVQPYFDKFFDILVEMKNTKVNKEFESFFWNLLPSMQVQDSHIVRLVSILQDTPDTDHIF